MSRDFDVVIAGSGITAAAIASLLVARRVAIGARIAVVADRFVASDAVVGVSDGVAEASDSDWGLRVFALSRASQMLLRHCGIWASLPFSRIFGFERMCVWAGGTSDAAEYLTFDSAALGEPNLGSIVEANALQRMSWTAARHAGVVLIEASIAELVLTEAAATIRLHDGRELRTPLLVAADGAGSRTRELLGIRTASHHYQQEALVGHVRTAKPHAGTAWQRFLTAGPLAFLPLPDGRSSIVWSVDCKQAAKLRALDTRGFGAAVTEASGGQLGNVELTTELASFPLALRYASTYLKPRAVLLGDAAHTVHPLAGQGLNMGLMDAASLVHVLGEAGGARAFGDTSVLRRYERWRKSENMLLATALDGLDRLFTSVNPINARLRAFGLAAVDKNSYLKRQFARRAMGLAGDMPPFLQSIELGGANEVVLGESPH